MGNRIFVWKVRPGYESDIGGRHYVPSHRELAELTRAEFKAATSPNPPEWAKGYTWKRAYAQEAHEWVARDGFHSTPLYVGEDRHGRRRVLYASG